MLFTWFDKILMFGFVGSVRLRLSRCSAISAASVGKFGLFSRMHPAGMNSLAAVTMFLLKFLSPFCMLRSGGA